MEKLELPYTVIGSVRPAASDQSRIDRLEKKTAVLFSELKEKDTIIKALNLKIERLESAL